MISLLVASLVVPTSHFRALLVGIDNYQLRNPHWGQLQGAEDAARFKRVIETYWRRGQSITIHEVLDTHATKDRITHEFTNWLVKDAQPQDKILFFFSGHGTLVPAPDLSTGVRSAILPIDARSTSKGILGESVITGAFFRNQLSKLKQRSVTNVTLIFDSCNSGAISRSGIKSKAVSNPAVNAAKKNLVDDSIPSDAHVISAARADRSAWQTDQGGNLTVAFARAVSSFYQQQHRAMTYADLKDGITANMALLPQPSVQEPAFTGDMNLALFGGKSASILPYYPVSVSGGVATIAAGSLYGIHQRAVFRIYKPGSVVFDEKNCLGEAIASSVGAFSSTVSYKTFPGKVVHLNGARALLSSDIPDARLSFSVSAASPSAAHDLAASLTKNSLFVIAKVGANADARINYSKEGWKVSDESGNSFDTVTAINAADIIRSDLIKLARHKAVLSLQSTDSGVVIEAQAVKSDVRDGLVTSLVQTETGMASAEFPENQSFVVRVRAHRRDGSVAPQESVYVALLDCPPNKEVKPFWPRSAVASESTRLLVDGKWCYLGRDGSLCSGEDLSALEAWHLDSSEGVGEEVIKVFATDMSGIEYAPLLTRTREASGPQNSLTRILSAFRDGKQLKRSGLNTGDFSVTQMTLLLKERNPS